MPDCRPARLVAFIGCLAIPGAFSQAGPVVENPAPPRTASLKLSATPLFTFGGLNNDARYELRYVWDADITETGRLVLVDARENALRVLSLSGQYQRTIGRPGQGPGEFEELDQVAALRGDTVAAYDNRFNRVTLINVTNGNVIRTISDAPDGICCFGDGSVLTRPVVRVGENATAPPQHVWSRVGRSGGTRGGESILRTRGNDPTVLIGRFPTGRGFGGFSTPSSEVPFARSAFVRVAGDVIVYAVNDAYEYRVYSMTGALLRTVRAAVRPAAPSPAELDSVRDRWMSYADTPEKTRAFREAFERTNLPPTVPAFRALKVERDGSVWLLGFPRPNNTQWWTKFDRYGKLAGTLTVPMSRDVIAFFGDRVLLQDSDVYDGVSTVFMHKIEPIGGE